MLENLYTTKMSSSKKTLQKRFTKIRSKSGRLAKMMSVVMSFALIAALGTATVVMAALDNDDTETNYFVELTHNGEKIELKNEPFVKNGASYVPLRELFEKVGVIEQLDSKILWNNGKIDIVTSLYNYQIEIGKSALIENSKLAGQDISNEIVMANAPVLRGSTTYVPFEYIGYIFTQCGNKFQLVINVWDKRNGSDTDREADYTDVQNLAYNRIAFNVEDEEYIDAKDNIRSFFRAFSVKDFSAMTNYCTAKCRNDFFGDEYCFGMTRAELTEMEIVETNEFDFAALITVNMTPHENSVFDKSQTSTSFYLILEKQSDGRYLIDEFATGL